MAESARSRPSDSAIDAGFVEIVEWLAEQLQAGHSIDVDQLLADHAEHAERLRQLLPAMQAVADLGGDPAGEAEQLPARSLLSGPPKHVGEFRLIREIGRGGMGIVYEAEQASLGRRVALKVLPFAAVLDPRQLLRFKNEAKAAATLHHTHIVPVHSVGCDRGVHYFAMQYIEGASLEAILRQLREVQAEVSGSHSASGASRDARFDPAPEITRQPPPAASGVPDAEDTVPLHPLSTIYVRDRRRFYQQVARWGIDAAEALEHAHFHGIVHRDVKPANLLIDGDGCLWVTDFGLARLESETGITMTGDVMGTLRYMSPEQAEGRRHVIDPRCDIYSLGATLYELLTLRPAFPAQERPKLLRQISEQEPVRPRAMDRSIPADLETIILKTLQKSPDDRYGSARELADDLRRFLDQKAIQAQRPSRWGRAVRWSRRHVETLTAVGVTLIITLLIAAGLLTQAYRQELRQRRLAEKERERAGEHLRLANTVVDTMYTRFAEEWLRNEVSLSDVQQEFLERAAAFYDRLSDQEASDPKLRLSMANAKIRLGRLYNWMDDPAHRNRARSTLEEALATLQQLAPSVLEDARYRYVLAWCHFELQRTMDRDAPGQRQALTHLQTAQEILQVALQENPRDDDARQLLSGVIGNSAMVYDQLREYGQAKRLLLEARSVAEQIIDDSMRQDQIAQCNHWLGILPAEYFTGDEKEQALRQTLAACRAARLEKPRNPMALENLAGALNNLAAFRIDHRGASVEEATGLFEETANILLELVQLVPDNARTGSFLVRTAGNINYTAMNAPQDVPTWQRAIAILERILAGCVNDDQRVSLLEYLADSYSRLAITLEDDGRIEEAFVAANQCGAQISQRERLVPQDRWPSLYIAVSSENLCQVLAKHQRREEAFRMGLESVRHAQPLLADAFSEKGQMADAVHRAYVNSVLTTTLRTCVHLSTTWGPESVRDACVEAQSAADAEGPWLLLLMAEAQLGDDQRVLDRITPYLERDDPRPAEMLIFGLSQLAEWLLADEPQEAVARVTAQLIDARDAVTGADPWSCPDLAGATFLSLAQAQHTLRDWQGALQNSQRAVPYFEVCQQERLAKIIPNDIRQLIGRARLMQAHARDQQAEFDAACQDASQATECFRNYLDDRPNDREVRRELSRALWVLSEANYHAGRVEEARRWSAETVEATRALIAGTENAVNLEDQRQLCRLLTRGPFVSREPSPAVQQVAARLRDVAADDPLLGYEVAWADYRRGDLQKARNGFRRFLEWSENASGSGQLALAAKQRSCLDGFRELPGERRRLALAGLMLTESSLGDSAAAQERFASLLAELPPNGDAGRLSMLEEGTLQEVARTLNQEDAIIPTWNSKPTTAPGGGGET